MALPPGRHRRRRHRPGRPLAGASFASGDDRVFPARDTSRSTGVRHLAAEVNRLYETNGDLDLRWGPGFTDEGRRFGFEAMAQFPLYHALDERGELDLAVGVGFRLLFQTPPPARTRPISWYALSVEVPWRADPT